MSLCSTTSRSGRLDGRNHDHGRQGCSQGQEDLHHWRRRGRGNDTGTPGRVCRSARRHPDRVGWTAETMIMEDKGVRKVKKTYTTGVVEVEETIPERLAEYVALLDDIPIGSAGRPKP